jgi:hypothetical protein
LLRMLTPPPRYAPTLDNLYTIMLLWNVSHSRSYEQIGRWLPCTWRIVGYRCSCGSSIRIWTAITFCPASSTVDASTQLQKRHWSLEQKTPSQHMYQGRNGQSGLPRTHFASLHHRRRTALLDSLRGRRLTDLSKFFRTRKRRLHSNSLCF